MININYILKTFVAALAVTTLAGCATSAPAPVVDLTKFKPDHSREISDVSPGVSFLANQEQANHHIVKAGETLYSIAWRYSLDHQVLAKLNNVKANTIYPGQKLSLVGQVHNKRENDEVKPFSSRNLLAAINKEILNKPIIPQDDLKKLERASQQSGSKPIKHSTSQRVANQGKTSRTNRVAKANRNNNRSAKTTKVAIAEHSKPVKQWIWPVNGKVVGRFSPSSNMNKGLDIVAKNGSPVRATAEGRVVYSGNGLRGYGQLVIIKHNEQFLSAYAHNKKIHVEENEVVKAGQRIAELGNTGSDTDKLHFEIRLKGKPVDPLNYLPKSGLM
ncbi:MAG: peptidoglycan DD-metalloendopeptidase family protein [Kangiellaceae bacterium]